MTQSKKEDEGAGERLPRGLMVSVTDTGKCLDAVGLNRMEQAFRHWSEDTPRRDIRLSRKRMLIIFLLIRYTGAKLNEVLALNPLRDFHPDRPSVVFRNAETGDAAKSREVLISRDLASEIQTLSEDPDIIPSRGNGFSVDPGFVRRKFYERAEACGLPKQFGGPEMIRKARAVELMQRNMPLPAIQMLLGHSTPTLTTSHVTFSEEDIRHVTCYFMEKEAFRKTSARNAFFGKIQEIRKGDIQSAVLLATIGGHRITTVITNDSLTRLGLKTGKLITAEIKAPWVTLQSGDPEPESSADNRFNGTVTRISRGIITTEVVVRISDGTELCAIVTTESGRAIGLEEGDPVWALFNGFSVVLHAD